MDLSKVGLLVHAQYSKDNHSIKKNALFLSVNVFSTKVLIRYTIFYGTAILRGHPSHAKVYLFAGPREDLHFSVILRPCVLIRPRESNPRLPALLLNALPTELTLPLNSGLYIRCKETDSSISDHLVQCSVLVGTGC